MTQILVNIESPEIVPNLRKVLGQFNGVTIESIESVDDKKTVLNSIEKGYREAMEAKSNGKELPDLDSLIVAEQES